MGAMVLGCPLQLASGCSECPDVICPSVALARRDLHPVQERNPRGYQYMMQLSSGAAFLGSTPEQLYARTGSHVASEAVAATRARGTPGRGPVT